MYSILKRFLFRMDAEKAHYFTFNLIQSVFKIPGVRFIIESIYHFKHPKLEREVFGLKFKNPVGLAAGLDKDAVLFEELGALGFGFVEVGTLTPLPQPGNDKPRLFRLIPDMAIINRMGFNNQGVDAAAARLKFRKNKNLIIGGNIGKNKVTPNENATDDYMKCYHSLKEVVDYFVVNVSSPNTPGLRSLQEKEPLTKLLMALMDLNQKESRPKPILLKIAPDLTNEQLDEIVEIVLETRIDGVIATNTTIARAGLTASKEEIEKIGAGGLSGKPLTRRSTEIVSYLNKKSGAKFPIIAVGGIMNANDAIEKLRAGASLVQVYTGFVYSGPGIIKEINKAVLREGL
jgi:dihydroorotate dehydrogenase